MQEQILDLLLKQEDVTWKTILYDLVRTQQMDPWDIDVSLLSAKYIEAIHQMQEHDLRISGKILLAAAFLLKIKSSHLVDHDLNELDKLIHQTETAIDEEELFDGLAHPERKKLDLFTLIPRNPQARNRKVSIHDLIDALQRAMATKRRILQQQRPVKMTIPAKKMDIMDAIRDMYHKITFYSEKDQSPRLSFSRLLPPHPGKQEKVYTYIPLLHLENEQKIEMEQEKPFEEIYVKLLANGKNGKSPATTSEATQG